MRLQHGSSLCKYYYVTTRNESPALISYSYSVDQNAGDSAVQSMDDVKDDPCVGFLLVAHCCHILPRTDMTNSRSVTHGDVDISSCVEPLCHSLETCLKSLTLLVLL